MKEAEFSLEWSAWKVWRHPKISLDIMENFYLDNEKASQQIADLSRERDSLSEENRKLDEGNRELSQRVEDLTKELEETRASLEQARGSLYDALSKVREQEEIDRMLADYEKKLDGIIDMKKKYERTIAELESRLRDASGKQALDTTPGFKPLQMDFTRGSELNDETSAPAPREPERDSDWLLDLPPF